MGWFTTFARSPRYLGQVSVLVPCVAVFLFSRVAAWFPVVGSVLSLAIALALPMAVLRRTASGDDELSVDATAIEPRIAGWFGPLLRLAMALAIALGPAVAIGALELGGAAETVALLAGALVGPALLVVAAVGGSVLSVLNPMHTVNLIRNDPLGYLVLLLCVAPLGVVLRLMAELEGDFPMTWLTGLGVLAICVLVARMLGLFARGEPSG